METKVLNQTKKCGICKLDLPVSSFYGNKTKRDRLQTCCKTCTKGFTKTLMCEKCGSDFKINHRNVSKRKYFYCNPCLDIVRRDNLIEKNIKNKKGYTITNKGYIYKEDSAEIHRYKLEHRKVIEQSLGRKLNKNEVVHHIDGNPVNNDIENLFLTNGKDHRKAHNSLNSLAKFLYIKGFIIFDRKTGVYYLNDEKFTIFGITF